LGRWQHIVAAELVDELRTSHGQQGALT
jgi:hypothetical protein